MFLETVLDQSKWKLLYDKYDKEYLDCVDYYNFALIYNIFLDNKFYFIEDLVINYLEIFTLSKDIVIGAIEALKEEYGKDYVYRIGADLRILDNAITLEVEATI